MKKIILTIITGLVIIQYCSAQKFQLSTAYGYKYADLSGFNHQFVTKLGASNGFILKEIHSGSIAQIDLRYSIKKHWQIGALYSFVQTPHNPFQVYTVSNNSLNGQLGTKGNFYIDIRTSFYQVNAAYRFDSLSKNRKWHISTGISTGLGYTRSIIRQYEPEGMYNSDLSGNELANYERDFVIGAFTDIAYSLKKWQHYDLQLGINIGYSFYQTQTIGYEIHFNKEFDKYQWQINLSGYHISPIIKLAF